MEAAAVYAHELPFRLRSELNRFRVAEHSGAVIVSGYPTDPMQFGPTPRHWKEPTDNVSVREREAALVLLGSLLGDIFGWATQQNGKMIHNILPIPGHEKEQLGSSSEELLWWHTEDAFHPYRPDYLGLMCMKNPDRVPTTYVCIDDIELDAATKRLLLESEYVIRPDNSHKPTHNEARADGHFEKINKMETNPDKVSVLFGNANRPYMRLDPFFMELDHLDDLHRSALETLIGSIDARLQHIILQPGDIAFIDNYKCVHGRQPFYARYDGNDRWLKRICITRNLRSSIDSRESKESRLVY